MTEMALASQQSTTFFPSQTASVPRKRMGRPCKKHCEFQGNQYTSRNEASVLLEGSSQYTQEQNESNTPSHVLGILLDLRHASLLGSRRPC